MKTLREALRDSEFILTAEIAPPKGPDVRLLLQNGKTLLGYLHAVNVTDNQRSKMRLGSLAACHLLKQMGHDPIMQITCRDRNRIALQSDLLNAHVLGIRNILALTGDYISFGDHPAAKPVYDLDSVILLSAIQNLNSAKDLANNPLKGNTDFVAGAALSPCADPIEPQIIKFRKKIHAGAQFFQTQAVFDTELLKNFLKLFPHRTVKIIAGVFLLKSAEMARFMNRNIPGVIIPGPIINEMEKTNNPLKTGISITARFVRELREIADGIHIMGVNAEKHVPTILKTAGI